MRGRNKQMLTNIMVLSIILFAIWTFLSGKFEVKFLLIGLFSSIIISTLCLPFLSIKSHETGKEYFLFNINYLKFIPYCFWLLIEIFKASLDVTKETFKPQLNYKPRVISFAMPYKNPMASVLLANSIILTPGTITISVNKEGVYEVHALNESAAEGVYSGVMQNKIAKLFKEECEFVPLRHLEVLDIDDLSKGDY